MAGAPGPENSTDAQAGLPDIGIADLRFAEALFDTMGVAKAGLAKTALADSGLVEAAAGAVGGGNVIARLTALKLVSSAMGVAAARPSTLGRAAGFVSQLGSVLLGNSDVEPSPRDARFRDRTWQDNPAYHRWMQAYLAWSQALEGVLEDAEAEGVGADVDWRELERAGFGMEIITSALAPTNVLPGNPEAIKRAFETGGMSLGRGLRNLVSDVFRNGGAPLQVDPAKYKVGLELAATPGSVIVRTELYELIQYAPNTEKVRQIPLVLLPPVVNRHYFVDMAPGMSMVEHMVDAGFTVFLPVWRNVKDGQGGHGMDDYADAVIDVMRAAAEISGAQQVNLFASCTAGTIALPAAALLEAEGDDMLASLGLGVSMVGYEKPSAVGMIAGEDTVEDLRRDAERGRVVKAQDIEQGFGWLKPDQLVWSFVRSRWLMGDDPLGTEVLAWSSSPTSLASGLAADFVSISLNDSFRNPGILTVHGVPVDLGTLKQDNYIVSGKSDHISPWQSGYAAVEELAGASRFILGSGGHLPTQVSPPTSEKAKYLTSTATGDADAWMSDAVPTQGSWWDDYVSWLTERSGDLVDAPGEVGAGKYPALGEAPGRYAVE